MNKSIKDKLWSITSVERINSPYLIQLEKGKVFSPKEVFTQMDHFFLELGSGWGEVAIELAITNPNFGFILLEKKWNRIQSTLKKIQNSRLKNIRIIHLNFNWFFEDIFLDNSIDRVLLNFPDPWPKKKHWKNRMVNPMFLDNLYKILKLDGRFDFATDYGPYARKVISIFRKDNRFQAIGQEYCFQREGFPISQFENRKKLVNSRIYYIAQKKI